MDIQMEVSCFDGSVRTRFFRGLTLGRLAVRESRLGATFREGPFIYTVGVDQEKLHRRAAPAETHCGHLQWQGLRNPR